MGAPRLERLDRNYIMNGAMEFWQRSGALTTTVNTASTQAGYTADRMRHSSTGPTLKNYSVLRSTDVPSSLYPYSYRWNCLTAIPSPNTADYVLALQQFVEGNFYADLHSKKVMIGFWITVNSPTTFPIQLSASFRNNANDRCYVAPYTVNANNTPQFIVLPVELDSSGTWLFDNGIGLRVDLVTAGVGATFTTSSVNQWISGQFHAATGNYNLMASNSNSFNVTGIQLIPVADLAEELSEDVFIRSGRNYADELIFCQRYYEKSYNFNSTPGSSTSSGQIIINNNDSAGSRNPFFYVPFKTRKRTNAIMGIFNPVTGLANSARGSDAGNYTVDSVDGGECGSIGRIVSLPALVSGSLQFSTDAEL